MAFDPSSDPSRYELSSTSLPIKTGTGLDQVVQLLVDPSTPAVIPTALADTSSNKLHAMSSSSMAVTPASSAVATFFGLVPKNEQQQTSGHTSAVETGTSTAGTDSIGRMQQLLTRSQLKIKSSDRKDSALYTCIAVNNFGRAEYNLQLMVQGTKNHFLFLTSLSHFYPFAVFFSVYFLRSLSSYCMLNPGHNFPSTLLGNHFHPCHLIHTRWKSLRWDREWLHHQQNPFLSLCSLFRSQPPFTATDFYWHRPPYPFTFSPFFRFSPWESHAILFSKLHLLSIVLPCSHPFPSTHSALTFFSLTPFISVPLCSYQVGVLLPSM